MIDLVIRGGTVVDGTGSEPFVADVAIHEGRVLRIGACEDLEARQVIDAAGKYVAPGFVDVHTHYDAQAFWDPTLSPSPLHGVTTVLAGNCGFTIAPMPDQPQGDYLMRMLARVEGMPLDALREGVPWGSWRSTGEFLDHLDGTLVPNAAFSVGHSALRLCVMGADATSRTATPDEIEAMKDLLRDGLAAGGLGFSSSWSPEHRDHDGNPIPSRFASADELVQLSAVVAEFEGTVLEFLPMIPPFTDDVVEVMAAMSSAANRPMNWNLLAVEKDNGPERDGVLAASDRVAAKGGRLIALTIPQALNFRLSFESGVFLDQLEGWSKVMSLPAPLKLAILADPAARGWLEQSARRTTAERLQFLLDWGSTIIIDTHSPSTARYEGRTVADVAEEMGCSPFDALCSVVVADGLKTGFRTAEKGGDDEAWRQRIAVWRDERTLIGGSDAGAHLDMIDTFSYTTAMLEHAVARRDLLPIEEAVHLITDRPARLFGLRQRGRVAAGWHADIVVFALDKVGRELVTFRPDLPGSARRIYAGATGIDHVIVNGVEVVREGAFTGERSGIVLRSGTHTETVPAR